MITRCGNNLLEKHRSSGGIVKCVMCGIVVRNGSKSYGRDIRDSLFFPELKGNPHICTACIFEKLTGDKREKAE